MKYSAKIKPGMGDPYWYEWSVGQQYIIDMLNPDNNIKCVELQANVKLGLDDVVVTYEGGEKLFVQVKHTRSNNTLTFGDLVSIDNTSEDGSHRYSLLGELAQSWIAEKNNYQKTRLCLSTNRKPGIKVSSAGKEKEIKRPALKLFLKCLEIETNQIGLEEIKEDLLQRLQAVFHTKKYSRIIVGKTGSCIKRMDNLWKNRLDWQVLQKPLLTYNEIPFSRFKANLRDSDNQILGVATDRYKVVQNEDAFAFTDSLLGEGVTYETF